MANDGSKQSFIDVQNADAVWNEADLPANVSCEGHVSVETTATANEGVGIIVSEGVDVLTHGDAQSSSKRVGHEGQSRSSNVANAMKVDSKQRKRTVVHERAALTDTETPMKRRRVQHNYRRLSSAGYVDDYDGRERFSGKQSTMLTGNSLSSLKSKSVDSMSGPSMPRQFALKRTRSRSKTDTDAVQG